MINLEQNLLVILPELIIACTAITILLTDLFIKDINRTLIYSLTQFSLLLAAIATAGYGFHEQKLAFNNMFVSDSLSLYLKSLS